jgi:S1-C subfamily serine protease
MINGCKILALLGLLSAVASTGFAADLVPDANQAALAWDFAPMYDVKENSAIRIQTLKHVLGSGVMLRIAGLPRCAAITSHVVTSGDQQIAVGERLGTWHVGTLVRADEQRQVDVYAIEDLAGDSEKCPIIQISQKPPALTTLILGMGYPLADPENPRILFGTVEMLGVPPRWSTGGDKSRTVGMNWMHARSIDLGGGVFNSRGELVGILNATIPSGGASVMELSTTVQAALDAAH